MCVSLQLTAEKKVDRRLLPPKKMLGKNSKSLVEKRQKELELYLQTLLQQFPQATPTPLACFLHFHFYVSTPEATTTPQPQHLYSKAKLTQSDPGPDYLLVDGCCRQKDQDQRQISACSRVWRSSRSFARLNDRKLCSVLQLKSSGSDITWLYASASGTLIITRGRYNMIRCSDTPEFLPFSHKRMLGD